MGPRIQIQASFDLEPTKTLRAVLNYRVSQVLCSVSRPDIVERVRVTATWRICYWTVLKDPNIVRGFPGGTSSKEPTCQCRRRKRHAFPASERSSGGEHGNPLQYSCLVHWVAKSQTHLKQFSMYAHIVRSLKKACQADSPTLIFHSFIQEIFALHLFSQAMLKVQIQK